MSAARASRLVGAWTVVAWMTVVGLVLTLPVALARGVPDALDGSPLVWFGVSGAANIPGLPLAFDAMRGGKVSIVAPITSTEGAIAAALAVAAGETRRRQCCSSSSPASSRAAGRRATPPDRSGPRSSRQALRVCSASASSRPPG